MSNRKFKGKGDLGGVMLMKEGLRQSRELSEQERRAGEAASDKAARASLWGLIGSPIGVAIMGKIASMAIGDPTGQMGKIAVTAALKGIGAGVGHYAGSRLGAGEGKWDAKSTVGMVKERGPGEFYQERARQSRHQLGLYEKGIAELRKAQSLGVGLQTTAFFGGEDLYSYFQGGGSIFDLFGKTPKNSAPVAPWPELEQGSQLA
jgi:hypothetical protein